MKTITIALLCASLLVGQSLTTVSDTIYLPVGADKFVGRVQIDAPSLTYGGVTYTRQTKTYTVTDGALSVTLVPNDAATPSGTSYTVRYYAAGRQPWSEIWVVPTSASALKVSDVRTATVPSPSMSVSPSQLVVTPYAILYGSAAGAGLNLAPNTSTTPKYLRQVGDGTTAGAPTWAEAETCPTCVTTAGSYSNPTWLTALDWSKLLSVPSTFTPSAHTHAYSSLSGVPSTFAPSAHASSHGPSAADPVTVAQSQVTGLTDALAAKQATITGAPSTWPSFGGAALLNVGAVTGTVAAGDDSRFTNARTPTAHAGSHGVGQPDAATLAQSQVTGLETALAGKVAGAASLTTSSAIPKVSSSGTLGEGILRDSGTSVSAIAAAGSEAFAEASFDTTTKWTLDGDFAAGTGKLTFTFSAGYAMALQASTDFVTALETPGTYTFAYTVANSSATGATVGLCDFAQTWCAWGDAADGAHAVSVLIPSAVTGLYLVVSAESGGLDVNDVSLKAVGGRLYGKSLAATRLAVVDSASDTGDTMVQFLYTVNPSANTTASYYGGYLNLEVPSTNSRNIGTLTGFTNNVNHRGTGTVDSVDGFVSSVQLQGPTTNAKNVWASTLVTNSATGVYSLESNLDVLALGSVDASLGWGSAAYLRVSGGAAESRTATLTNPKGLRILHEYGESGGLGTVTVTGPIGLGTELYLDSGASLDSFSHVSIGAPTINGTAAISGTLYGVYVGAQTGATTANYNIFSAGASTKNKFEGLVDVGSFKHGTGAGAGYVFVSDASGTGSWASSIGVNTSGTAAGLSATLTEARFPALTGDISTSAGSLTTTLATKHKTRSETKTIPDPVVADGGRFPLLNAPSAIHLTRLFCGVQGSTNVVLNLDKRPESAIGTDTGSHLLGSDLTTTSSGANTSTFSNTPCGGTSSCAVAAHNLIYITITSVSGTPTGLTCSLEYTID